MACWLDSFTELDLAMANYWIDLEIVTLFSWEIKLRSRQSKHEFSPHYIPDVYPYFKLLMAIYNIYFVLWVDARMHKKGK